MPLPPEFDEPAGRTIRREIARTAAGLDAGQRRVFRVLWFMVPPGSVVWNVQFQALLASRFLSDVALQALLYSVLIDRARSGGGAVDAALVGVAFLLPGVVLGMYGGAVADALPKRAALAGAYVTMGVLAFLIPGLFGTELFPLLIVLFAVRVAYQVSQPSEASTVPLVATEDELASATSFLAFASSVGEVVGKALLAPVFVVLWGVRVVTVVASLLFLLSATRVLDLRLGSALPRRPPVGAEERRARGSARSEVGRYARAGQSLLLTMHSATREMLPWLADQPAVLWTLLLAAMASTVSVAVGILGPQYTSEVLGVDPENALYVFAPAALGLVVALAVAPLAGPARVYRPRPLRRARRGGGRLRLGGGRHGGARRRWCRDREGGLAHRRHTRRPRGGRGGGAPLDPARLRPHPRRRLGADLRQQVRAARDPGTHLRAARGAEGWTCGCRADLPRCGRRRRRDGDRAHDRAGRPGGARLGRGLARGSLRRARPRSGVERKAPETRRGIEPEHEVEVLEGVAALSLHEVVQRRDHNDVPAVRGGRERDVAVV